MFHLLNLTTKSKSIETNFGEFTPLHRFGSLRHPILVKMFPFKTIQTWLIGATRSFQGDGGVLQRGG